MLSQRQNKLILLLIDELTCAAALGGKQPVAFVKCMHIRARKQHPTYLTVSTNDLSILCPLMRAVVAIMIL